jgi:hypothetical protein
MYIMRVSADHQLLAYGLERLMPSLAILETPAAADSRWATLTCASRAAASRLFWAAVYLQRVTLIG